MPMTSAEKSRRFREKMKKNPEAWAKHQAKSTERRKLARQKARAIRISQGFQKPKPEKYVRMLSNTGLNSRTEKNLNDNIHRLYKHMNDKEISNIKDLKFFKDTKKVIDFIDTKDWKDGTRAIYLNSLTKLKHIDPDLTDTYDIYNTKANELYTIIKDGKGSNKKTIGEEEKWEDWQTIQESILSEKLNDEDRSLIALFTLIPPRRTGLVRNLKMVGLRDPKKEEFNYLVVDYRFNPRYILMRSYKTFKTYGEYKLELPDKLKILLKKHIKSSKIKKGDAVYNFNTNIIIKAFNSAIGKQINTNIVRHAYITNFLSKKRTLKERTALATEMGHSVSMQLEYDRF